MNFDPYGSEFELIQAAAHNPKAREQLRGYLASDFKLQAEFYATKWKAPELADALYVAGMSALSKAVQMYLRKDRDAADGHFSRYFTWWARQAAHRAYVELRGQKSQ